jgi:hypothetical protein
MQTNGSTVIRASFLELEQAFAEDGGEYFLGLWRLILLLVLFKRLDRLKITDE